MAAMHAGFTRLHTHTHTQPFNGLLSGTTQVSRYQKKHSPTHTILMIGHCVIHTITVKYKYKLDKEKHKKYSQRYTGINY